MDLAFFKQQNPPQHISPFSADDVYQYKSKVADEIIEFWLEEGHSTYADGFFRATLPGPFHEVLSEWGLNGDECFVFMTTAMGGLIYYREGNFYAFDCHYGKVTDMMHIPDLLFNNFLSAPVILSAILRKDKYMERGGESPGLRGEEMYAFVPALALGGSEKHSRLEIVSMKEHLSFLAQLFDNEVVKD